MDANQVQQPTSDDQELAKALAGVSEDVDAAQAADPSALAGVTVPPAEPPADPSAVVPPAVDAAELEAASNAEAALAAQPITDPALDGVKKEAINELRPLVDKLNVSPEEKFDTYLLLIRSTDDKSLIAPAHECARSIQDETRRAQALLDIIKEIDYLSNPNPQHN